MLEAYDLGVVLSLGWLVDVTTSPRLPARERGLSQVDMARLTSIPERTYRRIETGEIHNPGIRYLTNIAFALGLNPEKDISQVCKWQWLEWQVFDEEKGPKKPPTRRSIRGDS